MQGRTRQRLARRLGSGVLLTALMLWRRRSSCSLRWRQRCSSARAQRSGAGTWRVLRGGSLGPDAPGLLGSAYPVCVQCLCDLHGPAAVLSRAVRHRLRAAGGEVRGAAGARRASRTGAAAAASAPAHGDCRAGRRGDAGGRRRAHAAQRGARSAGRACPGRRRRVLRHLHSRCIRPHGRSPAGGKGGGGRSSGRHAQPRGQRIHHAHGDRRRDGAAADDRSPAARTDRARTVRRCIWLLLAYHAVCLPLAACGVIGPAAAAVLACGASGGVLLCALRGKETKRERP